jgi:hypothetical protein
VRSFARHALFEGLERIGVFERIREGNGLGFGRFACRLGGLRRAISGTRLRLLGCLFQQRARLRQTRRAITLVRATFTFFRA